MLITQQANTTHTKDITVASNHSVAVIAKNVNKIGLK